jgi:hypothetical protein
MKVLSITVLLATLMSAGASLDAQKAGSTDWIRTFGVTCGTPDCKGGRENALNWDTRFTALLQSSFHQKQWFWRDNGTFTPLHDLVRIFIGVPGSVLLDDNRYVTVDGCVPHACDARGMLWIDTGVEPATLLFSAMERVSGMNREDQFQLWLFASASVNWGKLPQNYLASLKRWRDQNAAHGYNERLVIVTLVQPDGQINTITPSSLNFGEKN